MNASDFQPYFGTLDPADVIIAVVTLGALALAFLQKRGWFVALRPREGAAARAREGDSPFRVRRGLLRAALLAVLLSLPVILVDLLGGFAAEINVPPPRSLLFYPLIGLIAECVFHVIPLGVLAAVYAALRRGRGVGRVRLVAIALVALIEPALQVIWGSSLSPSWANAYVGVHVLAINLLGLYFFLRYDFVTMYFFRFVYYFAWHIVWGALRMQVIFGGWGGPFQ